MTRTPNREARLADLRTAIYDAALDADGWQAALARVAQWVEADAAVAYLPSMSAGAQFTLDHVLHQLPGAEQAFAVAEATGRLDPWTETGHRLKLIKPGFIDICEGFLTDRDYDENPWSDGYYKDADIRRWMGFMGRSPFDDNMLLVVSFFRRRRVRTFNDDNLIALNELRDDIERAGRMHFRLRRERTQKLQAQAALDTRHDATFVIGADGELAHANAAGEALMRDGAWLTLAQGKVRLGRDAREAAKTEFSRLLSAVYLGRSSEMVVHGAQEHRMFLIATPITHQVGVRSAVMVAYIAGGPPATPAERLVRLFGLSPAETEIACAIAQGKRLSDIAEQRATSPLTVKSQLGRVFTKTKVNSQSELARLVQRLGLTNDAGQP